MLTGPELVDSQRARILSEPPVGGSVIDSREFLTAKQTPSSRLSPWRNAWAFSMEILGCPSNKIPFLAFLFLSRGKPSNTPGIRLAAGVARKIAKLQSDRLRGSTPVFSFRVDSLSLSYPLGDHKAVVLFDP